jgi:hypothetical protein
MDLGAIVEVAIGIIFVWITLSLATIQVQEWITSMLDKRARDLEDSIHEMLANPNLKAQFYDHPVIRGLTARKRKAPSIIPDRFYRYPILRGFTKEKRKLPSYIPSQQFALALFDIAMTANTEASIIQQGILRLRDDLHNSRKLTVHQAMIEELNLLAEFARSAAATEAGTAITLRTTEMLKGKVRTFIKDFREKYPTIPLDESMIHIIEEKIHVALEEATRLKGRMQDVVDKQPTNDLTAGLAKLRQGVAALSVISPEVNQTLNALLMNVEDYTLKKEEQFGKARGNVEQWFNDGMDRANGVFKRYSQGMALLIGILFAFALNVDSINLTIYLWRDPTVRAVLADNATKFELPSQQLAANPEQAMEAFRNQFVGLDLPVGWVIRGGKQTDLVAQFDSNCQLFPGEHQAFGIPVFGTKYCLAPPQSNNQTNILLKTFGILFTALMARQGAPFWFDVLKRLVNVRSTGANPIEKEAAK